MSKKKHIKNKFGSIVLGCVAVFALGWFLLNHVATWEKPPLGNTFHIVFGCIFIAISLIVLGFAIKFRYFPGKKKKKSSRPVFLKEIDHKKSR
jgi:biotin transporter BioY